MGSQFLAQTAVNVLLLSSMYILVALGFALILAVMDVLNFSHAAIYTVGGYICYQLVIVSGINQWCSLIISMIAMGGFGLLLERFCFRPFMDDMNRIIVITLAIIVLLIAGINVTVGCYIKKIPSFVSGIIHFRNIYISSGRLSTCIIGIIAIAIMMIIIRKTRTGLQMLAIAQDREAAALQGIRINYITSLTTAVGCALASVAGCLMGSVFFLSPSMGDLMLVKSIEVVVLGGIGSVGGVIVGGIILGIIDAALPLYVSGYATEFIGLSLIILLLIIRPQGLYGREILK